MPQSNKLLNKLLVFSFQETAAILGYSPAAAYVARRRKIFPVQVRLIGKKLICFQTDVNKYITTGVSQAHLSVPAIKKVVEVKTGRPKKLESLEAARKCISVKELRAQAKAGE